MRRWLLLGLVACGSGTAQVQPQKPEVDLATDAAGLEKLLQVSVTNGGLWFADSECAAQFSTPGDVPPAKFSAFAKCLAGLQLSRSAREDSLGDVLVYSYAPGFEVEARLTNEQTRLAWIGYASRSMPSEPPTITVDALEALRASGDANGPIDPSLAAQLTIDPTSKSHSEYAWLKVCIDEAGKVTKAISFASTSPAARDAFVTAALTWTFNPFLLESQPVPVCAMVRPAYPPNGAPPIEELPLPLPASMHTVKAPVVLVEGTKWLEAHRLRGDKQIVPADDTKSEIASKRVSRITGTFLMCVNESGAVNSVTPVRSTGFADYDRKIVSGMQKWGYSPYMFNGKPVPVCTAVTFIYTQS